MKPKSEDISFKKIGFPDNDLARILFGEREKNIKAIERLEKVKIHSRGNSLALSGDRIS